jgi:hypothetical protein
MNSFRPKHFALVELVDEAIFRERGDHAWELLRPDALQTLDRLRDVFGPITINDWFTGGSFRESGLRLPATGTGAKWSMHKYGGAFDCKFKDTTPAAASAYILSKPEEFPLLMTLENVEKTVTWLHFDVRNHSREGIWVVEP